MIFEEKVFWDKLATSLKNLLPVEIKYALKSSWVTSMTIQRRNMFPKSSKEVIAAATEEVSGLEAQSIK